MTLTLPNILGLTDDEIAARLIDAAEDRWTDVTYMDDHFVSTVCDAVRYLQDGDQAVTVWDLSDDDGCGVMVTVDLPDGVRLASGFIEGRDLLDDPDEDEGIAVLTPAVREVFDTARRQVSRLQAAL